MPVLYGPVAGVLHLVGQRRAYIRLVFEQKNSPPVRRFQSSVRPVSSHSIRRVGRIANGGIQPEQIYSYGDLPLHLAGDLGKAA